MFTAYELAGVFTNLAAGMMGEERVRGHCMMGEERVRGHCMHAHSRIPTHTLLMRMVAYLSICALLLWRRTMGYQDHTAGRVVAAAGGHQHPLRLADKLVGARSVGCATLFSVI